MEFPQKPKTINISAIMLVAIVAISLFAGGVLGYVLSYSEFRSR